MRLQTGKAINALLSANEEVTRMVGDRIYPLVSKVDCKFPFIVYQRMSCLPTYTKDGLIAEEQNYSITVLMLFVMLLNLSEAHSPVNTYAISS